MKKKVSILNNADVKSVNKSLVLKKIKEQQPVSRQHIVSELGLSSPTVSMVFDELSKCNIIRECGIQKSSGGRRSILYEICPEAGIVLSVELKNASICIQLYNFLGEKIKNYIQYFDKKDNIVEVLNSFIEYVIGEIEDVNKILGIGICLSGYISQRLEFVESKNLGIKTTKIKEFLTSHNHLKYIIEDKIRSAAYYYKWNNVAAQYNGAILFIDINTGIGSSIIINNEIYRGFNDFAGEIGNLIFEDEKQTDGNYESSGCLEDLSSEKAIVEEVKKRIRKGESSVIFDMAKGDVEMIDIKIIIDSVEKEDILAVDVMKKAINYIFLALINAMRFLDPEKIYIMTSIGLKKNMDKLIEGERNRKIYDEIEERVIFIEDDEIFLKGAAAMVLGDVFEKIDDYFEPKDQDYNQTVNIQYNNYDGR